MSSMSSSVSLTEIEDSEEGNEIIIFFRVIDDLLNIINKKKETGTDYQPEINEINLRLQHLEPLIRDNFKIFLFEFNKLVSLEILDNIVQELNILFKGLFKGENIHLNKEELYNLSDQLKEEMKNHLHIFISVISFFFNRYLENLQLPEGDPNKPKPPLNSKYLEVERRNEEQKLKRIKSILRIKTTHESKDKKMYDINLIKENDKGNEMVTQVIIIPTETAFLTIIPTEIKHDFIGDRSELKYKEYEKIMKMIFSILTINERKKQDEIDKITKMLEKSNIMSENIISKLLIKEYLPWCFKPTIGYDTIQIISPSSDDIELIQSRVAHLCQIITTSKSNTLLVSDATTTPVDSTTRTLTNKTNPLLMADSGNAPESRTIISQSIKRDTVPEILIGEFVKIVYSDNRDFIDKPFIVYVSNLETNEYIEFERIKNISVNAVYNLYNNYLNYLHEFLSLKYTNVPDSNNKVLFLDYILKISDNNLKKRICSVIVYIFLIKEIADIIYLIVLIIEMNTKFHINEVIKGDDSNIKKNYDLGIVASGDYGLIQTPLIDIKIDGKNIDFELLQVVASVHIHKGDVLLPVSFMQKFIVLLLIIMENIDQTEEKRYNITEEIRQMCSPDDANIYIDIIYKITGSYSTLKKLGYLRMMDLKKTNDDIKIQLNTFIGANNIKLNEPRHEFPDITVVHHLSDIKLPDIETFLLQDYSSIINILRVKRISEYINFLENLYKYIHDDENKLQLDLIIVYLKRYYKLLEHIFSDIIIFREGSQPLEQMGIEISGVIEATHWSEEQARNFLKLFSLSNLETVEVSKEAYLLAELYSHILLTEKVLLKNESVTLNYSSSDDDDDGRGDSIDSQTIKKHENVSATLINDSSSDDGRGDSIDSQTYIEKSENVSVMDSAPSNNNSSFFSRLWRSDDGRGASTDSQTIKKHENNSFFSRLWRSDNGRGASIDSQTIKKPENVSVMDSAPSNNNSSFFSRIFPRGEKRKLDKTGGKKTIKRKNNKKHKKTIKRNSNNNKKSIKKKYYRHNITR